MGFMDNVRAHNTHRYQQTSKKQQAEIAAQARAETDVQTAILHELRRLNEQAAWQNQTLAGSLAEKGQ